MDILASQQIEAAMEGQEFTSFLGADYFGQFPWTKYY
jgi:hypothetical protein